MTTFTDNSKLMLMVSPSDSPETIIDLRIDIGANLEPDIPSRRIIDWNQESFGTIEHEPLPEEVYAADGTINEYAVNTIFDSYDADDDGNDGTVRFPSDDDDDDWYPLGGEQFGEDDDDYGVGDLFDLPTTYTTPSGNVVNNYWTNRYHHTQQDRPETFELTEEKNDLVASDIMFTKKHIHTARTEVITV